MKLSICMATYNGEKYIKKQLDSILIQLSDEDEIIISDDSSNDKTVEIIKLYNDNRIRILENQKYSSPIFNFENALSYANGEVIILSDQDDIWTIDKIETIKEAFTLKNNKPKLIMLNGSCINKYDEIIYEDLFEVLKIKKGLVSNIIKNSFIGCNLAFNKELLDYALPFPKDIPMHDSWLSTIAYIFGKVEFINKKVFYYRLHANNFTSRKVKLHKKILWRFLLIKNLFLRYFFENK